MHAHEAAITSEFLVRATRVFDDLVAWGTSREWIGPDPYEGLNAPVGRLAPGFRGRQAVVQLYKRLPVAPPWPLAARPRANSKALGLVLSAFCTPAGRRRAPGATADELAGQLAEMRLTSNGGWGWGYHFDVQTRHSRYGPTTPNAIATCFVVEALIAHGTDASRELALGSRPFLRSLFTRASAQGPYYAYIPSGSPLIHNANLLVAGALASLDRLEPDPDAASEAVDATRTTIAAQDERGLWPYGAGSNLTWADNFHTAYVLEGLHSTAAVFGVGEEALRRGLDAWRGAFFDDRGSARLYPDSPYPLEAHSFASAIDLCCAVRERDGTLLPFAERIAERAIELLWMEREGRFAYRVTRLGRNRREYMRWTNAPMLRALSRLLGTQSAEMVG